MWRRAQPFGKTGPHSTIAAVGAIAWAVVKPYLWRILISSGLEICNWSLVAPPAVELVQCEVSGRGRRSSPVSWCVIEQCSGGRHHGSSIGPGKSPQQGQVMRRDGDAFRWIQMAWNKPSSCESLFIHFIPICNQSLCINKELLKTRVFVFWWRKM